MRWMRIGAAAAAAGALALGPGAAAGASPAPPGGGLGTGGGAGYVGRAPIPGTDWTGPEITRPGQPSDTKKAGEVCPFAVREEFPVNKMVTRTWKHPDGSPAYAVTTGDLKIRATNLSTGRTVVRDIGGSGAEQWVDRHTEIMGGDHWSANMGSSWNTPHRLIVASTFMSVRLSTAADGTRRDTLLALVGPYEDLCETLAGKDGHHGGKDAAEIGAGASESAPAAPPRWYAAGELCAFPVRLTFPVDRMRTWSWSNPAYAVTTGDLTMRVQNAWTGRAAVRDIGGTGSEQAAASGVTVQGGDHWGGLMTARYRPPRHLVVASTYMSFALAAGAGGDYHAKRGTLLTLAGRYEDLCRTLR